VLTTCPGLHSIAERPGFELDWNYRPVTIIYFIYLLCESSKYRKTQKNAIKIL